MTYEGWTNWETWHTALLIDNEYDIYQRKMRLLKNKATLTQFKKGLMIAERMTRKFHREQAKDNPEGWGKFEKVNWKEIYKHSKDEFEEN